MIKGNILANLAKTLSKQHRWFSGRMLACHAGGLGSIPGRCSADPFFKGAKTVKAWCHNLCFTPPGGLEPPTFRLTAERASQLRHGGLNAAQ